MPCSAWLQISLRGPERDATPLEVLLDSFLMPITRRDQTRPAGSFSTRPLSISAFAVMWTFLNKVRSRFNWALKSRSAGRPAQWRPAEQPSTLTKAFVYIHIKKKTCSILICSFRCKESGNLAGRQMEPLFSSLRVCFFFLCLFEKQRTNIGR